MKYIEPPSQPKPKQKKVIQEHKQEKRDRRIGVIVAILALVSLFLGSLFVYTVFKILTGT